VHPNEALAIHAGSRVVASQSRGAGGFYDLVYSPRHPAVGTASWIRDAEQHGGYVTLAANPAVGSGWPLRYTFHCFVCQDDHPLTNSKMLRLIATEIIAGSREIRLLEP